MDNFSYNVDERYFDYRKFLILYIAGYVAGFVAGIFGYGSVIFIVKLFFLKRVL